MGYCASWQAFTAPSVGYCKAHGAPAHSCYMYSVSDDRYLKVSDKVSESESRYRIQPSFSVCLQSRGWRSNTGPTVAYIVCENRRSIPLALWYGRLIQGPLNGHKRVWFKRRAPLSRLRATGTSNWATKWARAVIVYNLPFSVCLQSSRTGVEHAPHSRIYRLQEQKVNPVSPMIR